MRTSIDLGGQWTVALDRTDDGLEEEWFGRPLDDTDTETVHLPGSLRESGVGDPIGPNTNWIGLIKGNFDAPRYAPYRDEESFKMPYWLQPDRHYVGVAWYEREVSVPEEWASFGTELFLERPHWQTTVWINGERIGACDSLSTPHVYDLSEYLSPGTHRLTIRIDNSLEPVDVGYNSHSVSDHTQTAWHGIVGDISLRATPRVRIDDVQVVPDAADRTARATIRVETNCDEETTSTVEMIVCAETEGANCDERSELARASRRMDVPPDERAAETVLTLDLGDDAPLWDEFDPSLCRLEASVTVNGEDGAEVDTDRKIVRFGLRDVTTRGTRIVLNDRPIYLRGTLECCVFPETGYPPTDEASWRRVIRTCQEHGLNHIRFHSWCPPESAFDVADEEGFYFQVECSSWANQSTALGEGNPVDEWLYEEAERVLEAYANHPSFLLFAYGNEPGGNDAEYLAEWVSTFQERERRCLVTGGSGWPLIEENEFHVSPDPRIHAWGAGLEDRLNSEPPATTADYRDEVERYPETPTVVHETGQWCAYPNFEEVEAYTGTLQPRNFEIFRDLLDRAGMLDRSEDFLLASGKLQELCYEEEIESALRTPGLAGFQLLMLHDFPGQGTALVGLLDAHFESKPYHDVDRFRRYARATVPLARLDQRVFRTGETLEFGLDVSHFGRDALRDATVRWEIRTEEDRVVHDGTIEAGTLETGRLHRIGERSVTLSGLDAPGKFTLAVEIAETDVRNDWDIWVYPESERTAAAGSDPDVEGDVTVVTTFDETTREHLQNGETVVLCSDPGSVDTDVELGFTSIFWNTAWTDNQAPHTLGICCDPDHPAFESFTTDSHTDWQWWELVTEASTMELDALPTDLQPIVQVVPDWFKPKKLGLVFEAQALDGRLLVTSIDLMTKLDDRPVAEQLRRSLLEYAASDRFEPSVRVDPDAVADLFE